MPEKKEMSPKGEEKEPKIVFDDEAEERYPWGDEDSVMNPNNNPAEHAKRLEREAVAASDKKSMEVPEGDD
ncbi:MAG: hypothetical protein ABH846_03020 [Patescibacteria group bacterium]